MVTSESIAFKIASLSPASAPDTHALYSGAAVRHHDKSVGSCQAPKTNGRAGSRPSWTSGNYTVPAAWSASQRQLPIWHYCQAALSARLQASGLELNPDTTYRTAIVAAVNGAPTPVKPDRGGLPSLVCRQTALGKRRWGQPKTRSGRAARDAYRRRACRARRPSRAGCWVV